MNVFGAGRTDSGVHAKGQVAHFELSKNIPLDNIRDGINQHLRPLPIAILDVKKVNKDFHARFSPLVKKCKSLEEAAQVLNKEMWKMINVRYHARKRPKPDQSPYESIDAVRFIGNFSSGKMGFSLAITAANLGAEVFLVTGPTSLNIENNNAITQTVNKNINLLYIKICINELW